MAINPHRKQYTENSKRGIALLVALIFMSVMLTLGITLASLGYKQAVLASTAIESQYAFYAADAALECALYADQQVGAFGYALFDLASPYALQCDSQSVAPSQAPTRDSVRLVVKYQLPLDSGTRCADVSVYKYAVPQGPQLITSYLFAQGYNVSCAILASPEGARISARGLDARY